MKHFFQNDSCGVKCASFGVRFASAEKWYRYNKLLLNGLTMLKLHLLAGLCKIE